MTIEKINPAFIAVAKAYNFTVRHCPILDTVSITDKDFYWDSSWSEGLFWDELKRSFYDAGVSNASRW